MMSQNKIVFIGIFIGTGLLIGFLGGQTIQKENTVYVLKDSGEKVIIEQDLPLVSELLLNPVYYEWWASAEGVIVSKDESSMVIEKDGNRATIAVNPKVTLFFSQGSEGNLSEPILYENVSIGSKVRGGVIMSKTGTAGLGKEQDVAVGTSFIVIEE